MPQGNPSNHQSSATSTGSVSASSISLIDIIYIIRKRWFMGAFVGVIVASALVYFLMTRPATFTATAKMTVALDTANIMNIREVQETGVANANLLGTYMNTHIERIETRGMAEAVADSLAPAEIVAFLHPYQTTPVESAEAVEPPDVAGLLMKEALTVERGEGEDSQTIKIIVTHPSAQVAQTIANAYMETFIASKATLRNSSTSEAAGFLSRQMKTLKVELEAAENQLQEFRQLNNLISVQGDQSFLGQRLGRINDAATNARIRLMEVSGQMMQLEETGNDMERQMEIPAIGGRQEVQEIYNQLSNLKRERDVLDKTYLRRHPKVEENEASRQAVIIALERAMSQAKEQVASQYRAIKSDLERLEAARAVAEQEVLGTERALLIYKRMERSVVNKREMLDKLSIRHNETNIAGQMKLNRINVLEGARLPSSPNVIGRVQIAIGGLFIGGICLLAIPLSLEMMDNRLTSFADVESFVGKPVLGDLRQQSGKKFPTLAQATLRMDEDLRESFRAIFSALRLRTEIGEDGLSLVITSSLPGEGKSVISSNLATVFSDHKYRVLLVDVDLRRSMLHRAFGLENEKGLVPWFESKNRVNTFHHPAHDPELGIRKVNENLWLLSSGHTSELPTEILESDKVKALFERLRTLYDVVIFDTPPVGLFPDATLVGDHADGCVFVTRQYTVKRAKLRYAVDAMDRSKAKVIGVVFNGIKNVSAAVGSGGQGRGDYGQGYEKNSRKYREYYKAST